MATLVFICYIVLWLGLAKSMQLYTAFNRPKTWVDAESVCKQFGGRLLKMESKEKMAALKSLKPPFQGSENFTSALWIGGHAPCPGKPKHFYWTDCDAITWSLWARGAAAKNGCVALSVQSILWDSYNCRRKMSFVCEKPVPYSCRYDCYRNRTILSHTHSSPHEFAVRSMKECQEKCSALLTISRDACAGVNYVTSRKTCTLIRPRGDGSTLSTTVEPYTRSCLLKECNPEFLVNSTEQPVESTSESPSEKCCLSGYKDSDTVIETATSTESLDQTTTSVSGTESVRAPLRPGADISSGGSSKQGATQTEPLDQQPPSSGYSKQSQCSCEPSTPRPTELSEEGGLEKMVGEMRVDRRKTSANRRKLTSAQDDRPSAKGLGYLGVVVLLIVVGSLVLLDLSALGRDGRTFVHHARHCLKKRGR